MKMDRQHEDHQSDLFTVRLWQEEMDEGRREWRGKVQHVRSGEAYYFCEWEVLITALLQMLASTPSKTTEE